MFRPQVGTPSSSPTTAGAGLGRKPWAVRTMPSPGGHRAGPDLVDAEHLEGGRRADHVDDRCRGPRPRGSGPGRPGAGGAALDLGQRGEGGEGPAGHPVGQAGLLDQADDVGVGADDHVVVRR